MSSISKYSQVCDQRLPPNSNSDALTKTNDMCGKIILWCWVQDDEFDEDHVFQVEVEPSDTIFMLKQAIRATVPSLEQFDPTFLKLWKFEIPMASLDTDSARLIKLEEGQRLISTKVISQFWEEEPAGNILSVILPRPVATTLTPPSSDETKLSEPTDLDEYLIKDPVRRWTVNGEIHGAEINGCYYVDPGAQNESKLCLEAILRRQFVLLVGARASGKTTRLFWLKRKLEAKGYQVIYISFERVNWDNVEAFWNSFGLAVQNAASAGPLAVSQDFTPLSSQQDFLSFFRVSAWKRNIILVIDEFSDLYHASQNIRDECLRAFREIRNNQEPYAIHGFIAAGTFSVSYLTPTFTTSPFNVADHVENPYFNLDETSKLFLGFARDNSIMIDDAIIQDVWAKSKGHPGMVCLCGRAISENFSHLVAFPTRVLSYKSWQTYSAIHLHDRAYEYITFRAMIASLLREEATPAVNLLRSRFVGFLETVTLLGAQEEQQADFLTAEGVLLQSAPHNYHLASAFVDGLIRRYLIPEKFPNAPSTPPPMSSDGRPRVLEVLTQSLKFFDKDLIRLASARSYKQSKVNVGGLRAAHVPRESVYNTELMRIFTNWLGKQGAYAINGQWHLRTDQNMNEYCDIIISKPTTPTVVLELLATGDVSSVRAHIEKTPYYRDLLSADEAWVVHFTCEDDYLNYPTWQSDEQLQREGINVVHFWHDQGFSTVSMSARCKDADGNIQEINNQHVAL